MTQIIIVDKTGTLKSLNVKDMKEDELYKKCGFKKSDGFEKRNDWLVKLAGEKYGVAVFAKTEGKANMENKYDFPPPIDTTLFFGSCAIICAVRKEDGTFEMCDLTLDLWEKIYEKLFGGFEDLAATCAEDEAEEDELANIPDSMKTKQGYLKDGFVIDSDESDSCDDKSNSGSSSELDETEDTSEDCDEGELDLEDIGSELEEDEYDE